MLLINLKMTKKNISTSFYSTEIKTVLWVTFFFSGTKRTDSRLEWVEE